MIANATEKRAAKGCDWILANDVSEKGGVFGAERNTIHFIDASGAELWPTLTKREVGERLADRIAAFLAPKAAE